MLKFLTFVAVFAIFTSFKIDPDLGWHLALGKHFLTTGQLTGGDVFSWTMPGYVWANSYVLYEIIVAYLFSKIGFFALSLLFGLITTASVFLLMPRTTNLAQGLVIFTGAALLVPVLGVRPHSLSLLFFSLMMVLLSAEFYKNTRSIVFWFLFFVIWGNIHRAAIVGFGFFSLFVFLSLIFNYMQKKKLTKLPIYAIFAGFLGLCANPSFLSVWNHALFLEITSHSNTAYIAEWQPFALYFPINIVFAVSGILFVYLLWKKVKTISPVWVICGSMLFAVTFLVSFMVLFWAAFFIFIVAKNWDFKFEVEKQSKVFLYGISSLVLSALILNFLASAITSFDFQRRLVADKYPQRALSYIAENGLGNHLYNYYPWGGYIDFAGSGTKVFIDGRMASWRLPGRDILADYVAATLGKCSALGQYDVKVVLLPPNYPRPCFADWKVVYKDSIAIVLTAPR